MKNIFELLDSLQYNEILLDEYINCLGIAFETDQAKIRNYMKQIKFLENTGLGSKFHFIMLVTVIGGKKFRY